VRAEGKGDGLEARGGSDAQVATGIPVRGRRWRRGELNTAFRIVASIVIPTFRFSARYHWHGPNRLPAEGAFVLAPNHFTNIDPLVVGTAVYISKRAPRFLAKASLFKVPVVGKLMSGMGQIPVERSGRTRLSDPLGGGRSLVEQGGAIIVYPEGTLTRDPDMWPMRGKTGAVRLALAADQTLPVIPVATWGVQEILPRYGRLRLWPPRRRVRVLVGPPVDLSSFTDTTPATLSAATDAVMRDISILLGRLRGEEPPAERWNPAKHGQNEAGRLDS